VPRILPTTDNSLQPPQLNGLRRDLATRNSDQPHAVSTAPSKPATGCNYTAAYPNDPVSRGQSHCFGSSYFSFHILKRGVNPPWSATDCLSARFGPATAYRVHLASIIWNHSARGGHACRRSCTGGGPLGGCGDGGQAIGLTYQVLPKVLLPAASARL
jgi:hypothetical protein